MIPYDEASNQLNKDAFETLQAPITTAVTEGVAPAIALAVYHRDALVLDAAWGWHDPDAQTTPVRTSSYFGLASLTKLYTTVALLTFFEQQGIGLHTPLVEVVPEFGDSSPRAIGGGQNPHTKVSEPVLAAFAGQTVDPKEVVLWHLLTHTSGLPPWHDVYNIAPAPSPPTEPPHLSQAERWSRALARLCQYPFVAPPNSAVRYSDIGLMLLGEVVARLAGSRLDQAIYQRVDDRAVYRPLEQGLSLDQIVPTEQDHTWRKRRVHGEVHDENACGVGGIAGHAGLFAQARTVAALGRRWLDQEFAIAPEWVHAATQPQATTGNDVRGLGWMLRSSENSSSGSLFSADSYGHTGFTGTSLWIDPQRQLVVALLTNRVYHGRERVGIHVLRRTVHDQIVRALAL